MSNAQLKQHCSVPVSENQISARTRGCELATNVLGRQHMGRPVTSTRCQCAARGVYTRTQIHQNPAKSVLARSGSAAPTALERTIVPAIMNLSVAQMPVGAKTSYGDDNGERHSRIGLQDCVEGSGGGRGATPTHDQPQIGRETRMVGVGRTAKMRMSVTEKAWGRDVAVGSP